MSRESAQRIESEIHALASRAVEAMYENPFWMERFGARGRRFADEDAVHTLHCMAEALRAGSPVLLRDYAKWLQSVLTSRAMCSRHIEEQFERLGEATAAAGIDTAEYVNAATAALRYESGEAARVQALAQDVIARAVDALYARHSDWSTMPSARSHCRSDFGYHLSYLADAIALERPQLFDEYLAWIQGFLERRRIPAEHFHEALVELRDAFAASPNAPPSAMALLRTATENLAGKGRNA